MWDLTPAGSLGTVQVMVRRLPKANVVEMKIPKVTDVVMKIPKAHLVVASEESSWLVAERRALELVPWPEMRKLPLLRRERPPTDQRSLKGFLTSSGMHRTDRRVHHGHRLPARRRAWRAARVLPRACNPVPGMAPGLAEWVRAGRSER